MGSVSVASAVTGLGGPFASGAVGIIRVGSGLSTHDELVFWDNTQSAWIGLPHTAILQRGPDGMLRQGANGSWAYPHETDGVTDIDNGFGFDINTVPYANDLYNAGLRLQERVSCFMKSHDGNAPRIAANWYGFDIGSQFLSPTPTNQGVNLVGCTNEDSFFFATTGWQNSPQGAVTNQDLYPEVYGKDSEFFFRDLIVEYRWVGGTVGATGGSDNSGGLPPVIDKIFSWHVADNCPVADLGSVTGWPDYSGFGRNLIQTVAADQPTLKKNQVNGHAAVSFDGSNDYLQSVVGLAPSPFTIFLVLKQRNTGATQQVWVEGGVANKPLLWRYDATSQFHLWDGGTEFGYAVTGGWAGMGYKCISVTVNGASSDIWENKTLVASGDAGTFSLSGLTLGASFDGTLPAAIDVAEVIIYYKALTSGDRNSIIDYLNAKYALF